MGIAKWDNSYRTGHSLVDHQHEELFRMVNALHDAIIADKGKESLGPTLRELARYTVEHFRAEEELMTSVHYPMIVQHKAKHEDLTHRVTDLVEKFNAGKLVLSITLSTFLADWLRHHIKEDDVALVSYLKAHALTKSAVPAHH